MANTKSAKKANRASLKKRSFNQAKENKIKENLKEFRHALTKGAAEANKALAGVFSALDKAVKTNFLPKQRVARKKSRLAAMVAKVGK